MADIPEIVKPAADAPAPAPEDGRKAAVKAWFDCVTDADRLDAVTKYPVLAEIYTLAATMKGAN